MAIKKNYKIAIVMIIIAAIAAVLIEVCFWGMTEVRVMDVTYKELNDRIGKYITIPKCLENSAVKCSITFPDAEPNTPRRVAKYTNFTLKNEYFIGYGIDFNYNGIGGDVSSYKGALSEYTKENIPKVTYRGYNIYYKKENIIELQFDKDGFYFDTRVFTIDEIGKDLAKIIIDDLLEEEK